MDSLRQAIDAISAKARELRDVFGDDGRARALEWASEQFEAALREHNDEVVGLEEAARISGYSAEHLARLVREGKIPDARPNGTKGRLVFRRRDVPVKLHTHYIVDTETCDLASRLFRGKEG